MKENTSFNPLNENKEDWGYFIDLENSNNNIENQDKITKKKNILKPTKFQYSDISYNEYCDEYKFNINDNLKKNVNNDNLKKNNKSNINIFYITSGIISLSLTILLINYKKYLNNKNFYLIFLNIY